MTQCDDLVVGSGVSGMTAALLLAMNGHRVVLIEKAPAIGGSLARYRRQGIPFDTGFHFTGGFSGNRLLHEMLTVLGMRERIQPVFFTESRANEFLLEPLGRRYSFPSGIDRLRRSLKGEFPGEGTAIDRFFDRVVNVCAHTATMELSGVAMSPAMLDEDLVTLQEVLDDLTGNAALKAVLAGFCMCYGTPPNEISFANHSRMCLGIYESVARVEGGGDAFVQAFRERFAQYPVDVRCGAWITGAADVHDRQVGRFILSSGEEIAFRNCIFTIHPKSILDCLPRELLSRAFLDRVESFEESSGFFSVFGVCEDGAAEPDFGSRIESAFPDLDVNRLLDPSNSGDSALVVIRGMEEVNGKRVPVISAFEPSFPAQVAPWAGSRPGRRPAGYREYKRAKTERIVERLYGMAPRYRGRFRVIDSASMLTFRDYLHSPYGSAYGVKQKLGQFNLVGRLPVRNCHAAGQSAVLPGLVGAMVSSFIVTRAIVSKEVFQPFVSGRLS
jgi:all-trans-retinol 13,14-reductase